MKKKAVLVDDNEHNLMLEKDLLELAGFAVYAADNATFGIELVKQQLPDIIVMDVRLTDMSGPAAIEILRKDPKTHDIPVVFVTASVMTEERKNLLTIPNSGYMAKPINTRTFAKEINSYIR